MKTEKVELLVPPEGGWGYFICIGFTMVFSTSMGHSNSFGLLFNAFIKDREDSSSILTSVHGVCGLLISLAGLFIGVLLKRYTVRQVAITGAIFYTLCWFFDIFITSASQMLWTNGVLSGIGWGLIMPCGYTIFNSYFARKRVMMMSLCMSIVGLASVVFPFIIEHWIYLYGYRGAMSLVAAITAHTIAGACLYQPVERHLIPRIIEVNSKDAEDPIVETQNGQQNIELKDVEEPLMGCVEEKVETVEDKQISETSMRNGVTATDTKHKQGLWSRIVDKFDLSLFKSFSFCNICLGISMSLFSDLQFNLLKPLLLVEYNLTQPQIATCVSITAMADLVFRILLTFISHVFDIKSWNLFLCGIILSTIGRLVFLQFTEFMGVAIMLAVLGALRGLLYIPMPLLCAEIVSRDRYAAAYGLTVLSSGALNSLFAPFVGLARDMTGTFVSSFYVLAFSGLIVIIPWTIELCCLRNRKNSQNSP